MVSGSQRNEGRRSPNSLFGSSETLQDNIKDLFWKLSQGSGDPGITVEAILRQVRQPGVNTSEETSTELVSYLEKVGSLLTGNPVRLIAKAEEVDSRETQLQHRESSTQVYPVNTHLLAERFRQRQGTNGNPSVEALRLPNDVPLALPAPAVCTREDSKQNTTPSPSSRLDETTLCSEKQILSTEEAVSVDDGANVAESCIESSRDQKQSTEVLPKDETQQIEQEMAVVEAEPKTKASLWDSEMMAFCSFLVGSSVVATVSSLTRNHPQTSTGNGSHCDLNTSSSSEERKQVSDEALMPLVIRQDPDVRKNVASTSKEVGTQHEEVIDLDLPPCNVPVLHTENQHTLSESDPRFSDEVIPNAICLSPKCDEQRKLKLPENIESFIARALISLRPDDKSTSEKKHFFNLEDNSYQEAINAIHEQIGEFDYYTLKQELAKEYCHSLPKYEADITHDQSHFVQEVTYPLVDLEELETLEEWRRCVRVEVKRRLERERTGPSKPDQGSPQFFASTTHKAQVPDLVAKRQNLSPKGIDKTSPKEAKTCVEDSGPCGSVQGKKRGHVEIQRLSNPRDRHEDKVEDNSRSRKKPKPQIAFGRRVYKSEKENKAYMDVKQQTTKNASSDRKRPRSGAIDPLYSDLNKVDVSGPEDSYSNGEDSLIDTLVNVLLSKSTTKFANPDARESSVDFGVEDPHQVEDVMHAPMLDLTNQNERNGMDDDMEDHDFVEELVNLFPIADVVLPSQLNQKDPVLTTPLEDGVADCIDNRAIMESSNKQTKSQESAEKEQVLKGPTTEVVVDTAETRALKDQQNISNIHPPPPQDPNFKERLPNALPKDPVCPQPEFLKETRFAQENSTEVNADSRPQLHTSDAIEETRDDPDHQENTEQSRHLLRLDNDILETPTSSDEYLPTFETKSSATTSTSESTDSQHRLKDQRHWKDFKKRHLVQRRERLYTKHGIFDPLLFTSSEVDTTSESDFSTCYAKQATSSSIAHKETLK